MKVPMTLLWIRVRSLVRHSGHGATRNPTPESRCSVCPSSRIAALLKTSDIAKKPTSTLISENPPESSAMPK